MSNNRQMDVKMVEIAVGILGQEPKDNIAPAREWAVDVIDHYAEVKPSPEVRFALVHNQAIGVLGYSLGGVGDYVSAPTASPLPNPTKPGGNREQKVNHIGNRAVA